MSRQTVVISVASLGRPGSPGAPGAPIDDGATGTNKTWSSQQIATSIAAAITAYANGDGAALQAAIDDVVASIGPLTSLSTAAKSSIVAAVNEVLSKTVAAQSTADDAVSAAAAAQATANAAAVIDDASTTTAAWSAAKIMSEIVAQVAATVDAAPDALNTLNELAAALGDNPDFAATVTAAIAAVQTQADDLVAGQTQQDTRMSTIENDLATGQTAQDNRLTAVEDDVTALENGKVSKSGDTMTGPLVAPSVAAVGDGSDIKTYGPGGGLRWAADNSGTAYLQETSSTGGIVRSQFSLAKGATSVANFYAHPIALGAPTAAGHAARLQDVTSAVARFGVNPRDYGAKGDGTTDDTAAIQAAANTGEKVLLTGGDYLVSGSIVFPGDMNMDFIDGAKIIAGTGAYSKSCVLYAEGSITQISDLGANATQGQTTLTMAASTTLAFDDLILIFNPTQFSWSGWRNTYYAGEFCNVVAASGTAVTLQSPLFDSYTTAAVDVYKVSPVAVELTNMAIESNGGLSDLVRVDFGRGVKIVNPTMTHANAACIRLDHCVDIDVSGGRVVNKGNGTAGTEYGLSLVNCQGATVAGGYWYGRRHGVASGSTAAVGSVPCRDITYFGCRIANDPASGVFSADMHGNAEFVTFHRCHIANGATLEGANVTIEDCDVYGGQSNGPPLYASEILGGSYRVINNRFYCFTDPYPANQRGVLEIGGSSDAITDKTTRDLTIEIVDNEIISDVLDPLTSVINISNRGSTKKINVRVEGNDFRCNDFTNAVKLTLISGTAASDFLIFDNNRSKLTRRYAFHPEADYVNGLGVLRVQAHRWTRTVTTSTTASFVKATPYEFFRWKFPRNPAVTAAVQNATYATGNFLGHGRTGGLSGQGSEIYIASDVRDSSGNVLNFPGTAAVTLAAEAAIREV